MSKRSKACEISKEVRQKVYDRDNGLCIFCGRAGIPNAHFIERSRGGLGIEQNVITACIQCHHEFDNGKRCKYYEEVAEQYLRNQYENWNKEELIYKKY